MIEPHPMMTEELREMAVLFSLGLLEPETSGEFGDHLSECQACQAEVLAQQELAADISLAAPVIAPPPHLREKVLGRLKPKSYVVTRGNDAPWQPFGPPGIDFKPLVEDPSTGTHSFLLRLAPGAVLPPHRHKSSEHCYVVEGEVFDREHSLQAGDYELRLPGSKHNPVSTKTGAIVLIVAGNHDEHHG